jgi:hypothetical protein
MTVLVTLVGVGLALILLYRMLTLLGGSGTAEDRDGTPEERRRIAQQLDRRRTDAHRRAMDEAYGRDLHLL